MPILIPLIIVCLILIGVGMVLAAVIIAAIVALVALGVISSSVLVGVTRKSPTTAIRIFVLQSTALIGGGAGAGLILFARMLFDLHLTIYQCLSAGVCAGILGGLAIGVMLNFAWGRVVEHYRQPSKAE